MNTKNFILKVFFPEEFRKLQQLEETKKFVLNHFGNYAPLICGEGWTSTMRSEDPKEILQAYITNMNQYL